MKNETENNIISQGMELLINAKDVRKKIFLSSSSLAETVMEKIYYNFNYEDLKDIEDLEIRYYFDAATTRGLEVFYMSDSFKEFSSLINERGMELHVEKQFGKTQAYICLNSEMKDIFITKLREELGIALKYCNDLMERVETIEDTKFAWTFNCVLAREMFAKIVDKLGYKILRREKHASSIIIDASKR